MTEHPQDSNGADEQSALPVVTPSTGAPASTPVADGSPTAATTDFRPAPPLPGVTAADQAAAVSALDARQVDAGLLNTNHPAVPAQPAHSGEAFGLGATHTTTSYSGPYAGQHPSGPADQHPYAGVGTGNATAEKPKRRGVGLLIAGLAIGAFVGGATGAGTSALIAANQGEVSSANAPSSQNVTINDATDVTRATAVAAKAAPSVVTIAVQGGESAGSGSGIILSKDGYVLTNNHVVTLDGQLSDPTIQVTDNDGNIYAGTVVGTDPVYDLAVIKLTGASGLTPIEFADSDKLNVGAVAVAIGAPLGLAGTVTDGIVSALNRSITVASSAVPDQGTGDDSNTDGGGGDVWGFNLPGQENTQTQSNSVISLAVIQTDAAINPGNSGGALVDGEGKLIGVNVAIASAGSADDSTQSGSIGVGFAITANVAERIAKEIIEDGTASHGLLGATVGDAASAADSPVVGALINEVTSGGAAAGAGLQKGDIVTNFAGHPVTGATDLTAQVRALAAGAEAEVTFVRDGEKKTATVTLGELVL